MWNGDRAITDTFMLDDGTLVYHTYNVTSNGQEYSHQIMDEYGRHIYARAIGGDHPWIELDRMNALRWLSTLSLDKLHVAISAINKDQLHFISDIVRIHQQLNMKNVEKIKKMRR